MMESYKTHRLTFNKQLQLSKTGVEVDARFKHPIGLRLPAYV